MRISVASPTLVLFAALGCAGDGRSALTSAQNTDAPAVVNANGVVGLTTGFASNYDATRGGTVVSDPAAGGLTYRIALTGSPNGLSTSGGSIIGIPTTPGVIGATLTATDGLRRTVTDQFSIVVFAAGLPTPSLPVAPYQYTDAALPLPAHFRTAVNGTTASLTDNTPVANPITNPGAALGRVLFHDPRLSANDGLSCASCHIQSLGFSDRLPLSVGFAGGFTGRHTPGLTNARFYRRGRFFWDERAATLEDQVLMPIQNSVEMGMTLDKLVLKLLATPYYAPLFTAAFGSSTITTSRVSLALAQYTRALVSTDSRYDRAFTEGVPNFAATFTAEEQLGERLFRTTGCASCHATVTQASDSIYNIGLDAAPTDTGAGGGAIKAPSLRNVAVRPRLMHDGRFSTLMQVVDFFDADVQPAVGLDVRLKSADGTPKRLGLTAAQKSALVAFMRTLTDSTFLTAARFASPFTAAPLPPVTTPAPLTGAVTLQFTAYHPASITVGKGARITFTNLDNQRHSASFSSAAVGATPIFTSGSQSLVMSTTPGSYHYQCAVHGAAMSGTVIVQ